tara:strand:- start:1311 stop:2306 length:996 start_codon:yes stop_codon:yes gene_type:complete
MVLTSDFRFINLVTSRKIQNIPEWKKFFKRSYIRLIDPFRLLNIIQLLKPQKKRVYRVLDESSRKVLIAPTFPQRESIRTTLYYQKDFFKGIADTVKNLDCKYIIDIGANIGYYSRAYGLSGKELEIISIEPDIKNLSFASNNLDDLTNVFLFHMGISDTFGRFLLSLPENTKLRKGEKRFITGHLTAIGGENDKGNRFFKGDDLLDFLNISASNIGWIKIDVEGFEMNVINGFLETLAKTNSFIELEINPKTMQLTKTRFSDFLNVMDNFSYTPFINDLNIFEHMEKCLQFDVYFVKNQFADLISPMLKISKMNDNFISTWEESFDSIYN